jgi:hypothetical protein
LHLEIADWFAHGHETEPSYNQTILHIVLWESLSVKNADVNKMVIRKANGEEVPTVVIQHCLLESVETLLKQFQRSDSRRRHKFLACQQQTATLPGAYILDRLKQIGTERLYARAKRFETWLNQGSSFPQVLYEAICEGLGYSSNQRPFVELARRLPLEHIEAHLPNRTDENPAVSLKWIQAMLFGVAGLLPQPGVQTLVCTSDPETQDYVTELRSIWEMLRPCLDVVPMQPEEWHFFRLRPVNFPTRRIAALSYLVLNYTLQPVLESYLRLFTLCSKRPDHQRQQIRLLEGTLAITAAGYWKGRYLFGKPAFPEHDNRFLGQSRIRDIMISAVFPVFLLYALHTSQPELESQILTLYQIFPSPSWNSLTKTISEHLFTHRQELLPHIQTASMYQGMLHLSKHYCSLPTCSSCPFGKSEQEA